MASPSTNSNESNMSNMNNMKKMTIKALLKEPYTIWTPPRTLADVKYKGESLLVRITNSKREAVKEYYNRKSLPLPSWYDQKLFLVIGEIAQKKGHFIVVDPKTCMIIDALHGFHGNELEIAFK